MGGLIVGLHWQRCLHLSDIFHTALCYCVQLLIALWCWRNLFDIYWWWILWAVFIAVFSKKNNMLLLVSCTTGFTAFAVYIFSFYKIQCSDIPPPFPQAHLPTPNLEKKTSGLKSITGIRFGCVWLPTPPFSMCNKVFSTLDSASWEPTLQLSEHYKEIYICSLQAHVCLKNREEWHPVYWISCKIWSDIQKSNSVFCLFLCLMSECIQMESPLYSQLHDHNFSAFICP